MAEWLATDFLDRFIDTPGTTLESHVPEVGTGWTRTLAPSLAIDPSRMLRSETASGNTSNYQPQPQPSSQQYIVTAQFLFDPQSKTQFWQISARAPNNTTDLTGYTVQIQQFRAPNRYRLRVALATIIQYTSADIPLAAGDAPIVQMLITDAKKAVSLNGAEVWTSPDNTQVNTFLILRGLSDSVGPVMGDLPITMFQVQPYTPAL